jgi:hypothetical protein
MQQQISPAVIVVVIIVVILVLIAMWHFIYGQQAKAPPVQGNMLAPQPGAEETGEEIVTPPEGEAEEGAEGASDESPAPDEDT